MTDSELIVLKQIFVLQTEKLIGKIDPFDAVDIVYNCSAEEIFSVIKSNSSELQEIKTNNIPQFSDADVLFLVLKIIIDSGMEGLTYEKIGYFMCSPEAKKGAKTKYGENHYKLAVQLGLARAEKPFSPTEIGVAFYLLDNQEKQQIIKKKLALRIPIIQQALILAEDNFVNMDDFIGHYLSRSTTLRRRSNIRQLISYIMDISDAKMQHRLNNLLWSTR